MNLHLPGYEQIKKFRLLNKIWSVETDELTPTLKLKRNFIEKKYLAAIEQMY
ncbi:MAG TPA: hypothetical protein PKA90_05535 [Ignavibacteria bacterium]|nr:hypothetical protein [Ignavibacteria bacterium]HMR39874.1 hypothetical protein [Ignavibacteria bacterium]